MVHSVNTPRPLIRTLEPTLERLTTTARVVSSGAAAVAWLIGPGDLCETCPAAPRCPDRQRCLHRVATSADDGFPSDTLARVPLGSGPVGRVGSGSETAVPFEPIEAGLADEEWLAARGARAGAALPLVHGGRPIGVLAVLSGSPPGPDRMAILSAAAELGAEAIGNVSAYRALAADRNRLAAQNARLRSGLGLPLVPEPAIAPAAAPVPEPAVPEPAPAPTTTPATLPPDVLAAVGAMLHAEVAALPVRPFSEVQREGILRALERTGWKVSGPSGAASLLGLKPTTLESKMKKLGIRRPLRQR
jgi:hypothetical protein